MKYYIRKLLFLVITLLLVTIFTFLAFHVIPSDGAVSRLGMDATTEQIYDLREKLGLNESILKRFFEFLSGAIQGDFGESLQYQVPVLLLFQERLPVTIWVAALSFLLLLFISIPLGLISAGREGGILDRMVCFFSQIGMAIPPFFLGMLMTLLFGIVLEWFVPGQYVAPSKDFFAFLSYIIYPALAIALPKACMTLRFLRSSVLREMKQDYVRTARSKGESNSRVMLCHVLKNAMIPVITFLGMVAAESLAGSIMIEQVYNLPGMGRLLVTAISNRDFNVVQAGVLYIAGTVVIINFIVDMLYQYLDQRIQIRSDA